LAEDFEPLRAVGRKTRVHVIGGGGMEIDFDPKVGKAVPNGLEIKRII